MRDSKGFPFVGFEYEYIGQPVTVRRIVPCQGGSVEDAHIEFESRCADRSDCTAGELGDWMKQPPTSRQVLCALTHVEEAHRSAMSKGEKSFLRRQDKELAALLKVPA